MMTKRVGTGVIITGSKNDLIPPEAAQEAFKNMLS